MGWMSCAAANIYITMCVDSLWVTTDTQETALYCCLTLTSQCLGTVFHDFNAAESFQIEIIDILLQSGQVRNVWRSRPASGWSSLAASHPI